MRFFDGFANTHTFFVHAPVVLIPTAAAMVWLGRRIRTRGFELGKYLITVAATAEERGPVARCPRPAGGTNLPSAGLSTGSFHHGC